MQIDTNLLGFCAATLTTIAFIPQVLLVWRQRSAAGVSAGMYTLFTVGVALWLYYGIIIGSLPVIIANGVTLVLASSVLAMKWHFGRGAAK
jgi:MtN3 and saliva related transmembrane protein